MSASRMGAAVARRLQLPPGRKKQLLALAGISHSANAFDPRRTGHAGSPSGMISSLSDRSFAGRAYSSCKHPACHPSP
jgi:hypothetical protein